MSRDRVLVTSAKVGRALSVLVFSVGFLLGTALFGATIWGDLEASLFNASMGGEKGLPLRCPVMITARETGTVSPSIKNTLERATEFTIRTHISHGHLTVMKELITKLPLKPGERQRAEWPVFPEDAAFGSLILVRVYVYPKYPIPDRVGTCGIWVLDWPLLNGTLIYSLILVVSLLGMGVGIGGWIAKNRPLKGWRRTVAYGMGTLAGCVLTGTIVSLLGWWIPGVLVLTVLVLLVGAFPVFFVNRTNRQSAQ
jgi:hypothetical protein